MTGHESSLSTPRAERSRAKRFQEQGLGAGSEQLARQM